MRDPEFLRECATFEYDQSNDLSSARLRRIANDLEKQASERDKEQELIPVEAIALTVGLAQTLRGEGVTFNTAKVCVLALARIAGRHDWTVKP